MKLISNIIKLLQKKHHEKQHDPQELSHTKTYENSEALIKKLRKLLSKIEKKNIKIVGGVYSTSGHNNQSLVSSSIYFANDCLDATISLYPDSQLIDAFINKIKQSKPRFDENHYDPDGAGIGTLVDVENALKKLLAKQSENNA